MENCLVKEKREKVGGVDIFWDIIKKLQQFINVTVTEWNESSIVSLYSGYYVNGKGFLWKKFI